MKHPAADRPSPRSRTSKPTSGDARRTVERVQTGFRIEKRMLKVLKALGESLDLSLGDLVEGIVLHAFEGKAAFRAETLAVVADLKRIYGLELTAEDSHRLRELPGGPARAKPRRSS
jgi:hypothetical protein